MMKITEHIYASLGNWGNKPAIIDLSSDGAPLIITAGELKSRINDTRDFLKKAGIMENQIIALFLENSADFIAVFLALIDIGAKPVPVNMAFRKIELSEIMSNADPHAIITETKHLPVVSSYCRERIVIQRSGGKLSIVQEIDPLKREASGIDESIATINYTYRGYGYPLGAMVPHEQYLHGAAALVEGLRPMQGENMLAILPFCYIFPLIGSVCVPLLYGITTIISPTVNPLMLFKHISEYNINIITAVPELYELMLNLKDPSVLLPSLSIFVSGGSILKEEQFMRIQEAFNVEVLHGYGLTEFTPVSRNMRGEGRPGSIGPLCSGVDCRIVSEKEGDTGEIRVRAAGMTRSYYLRPAETSEAFEGDWFGTGDTGLIGNGHLFFKGEIKGTRKVKGNVVDLEELRRAIMMYPAIHNAEVEYRDSILSACIEIDSSNNFNEETRKIKKHLEGVIAPYKIPKMITRLQ